MNYGKPFTVKQQMEQERELVLARSRLILREMDRALKTMPKLTWQEIERRLREKELGPLYPGKEIEP